MDLYIVNATKNPIRMDLGGTIAPSTRTVKAHGANKYTKLKEAYTTRERNNTLYVFDIDVKDRVINKFFKDIDEKKDDEDTSEAETLATLYHGFVKDFEKEKKEFIEEQREELFKLFEEFKKELLTKTVSVPKKKDITEIKNKITKERGR